MFYEHFDASVVETDKLEISNHILLNDPITKEYENFYEFLNNEYSWLPVNVKKELDKICSILTNNILQIIHLNKKYSIAIRYALGFIEIIEHETPMSRRYRLNMEMIKIEDE